MSEESKHVIVTVSDDAISEIQSLASRLRDQGMTVKRVLPITGVISGSVTASKLGTLRRVSGVTSVEEELNAYPTQK